MRADSLPSLAYLLDHGIKVALVYGDRDYACNWVEGERAAGKIAWSWKEEWKNIGFAELWTEKEGGREIAGYVKQVGNFSFSRVLQAGHEGALNFSFILVLCSSSASPLRKVSPSCLVHNEPRKFPSAHVCSYQPVPSYQPEISLDIFNRALFNRDIATGQHALTDNITTTGPASTWHIKNAFPERPKPRCYVLNPNTCTEEQWERVKKGGRVRNWILLEDEEEEWEKGVVRGRESERVLVGKEEMEEL
jgi:hypothetical protein